MSQWKNVEIKDLLDYFPDYKTIVPQLIDPTFQLCQLNL